jgi:DNA-binding NtrC family response regulator
LFESELFGHEKGAFTGATERAIGKIEAANGGTLFLDEIAEIPLSVQAKLLRFLENRRFMRVGGSRKIAVDCRLVCATLRPLEDEVKAGRFRPDLFYRVQGITLRIPPLRERRADLGPLLQYFIREFAVKHDSKPVRISRGAMVALREYSWPGNVRELRNVIERVTLLRSGKSIRLRDLPDAIQAVSPAEEAARDRSVETLEISLSETLEEAIHRILEAVLRAENGNKSRTARRLGISLRTVQRHCSSPR